MRLSRPKEGLAVRLGFGRCWVVRVPSQPPNRHQRTRGLQAGKLGGVALLRSGDAGG